MLGEDGRIDALLCNDHNFSTYGSTDSHFFPIVPEHYQEEKKKNVLALSKEECGIIFWLRECGKSRVEETVRHKPFY